MSGSWTLGRVIPRPGLLRWSGLCLLALTLAAAAASGTVARAQSGTKPTNGAKPTAGASDGSPAGVSSSETEAEIAERFGRTPPDDLSTTLQLDLRMAVSATEAPLLGTVWIALDLYRAEGVELEVPFAPAIPKGFGGAVTGPVGPSGEESSGAGWRRYLMTLTVEDVETLAIPSFEVRDVSGELVATTRAAEVRVLSLLDASDPGSDVGSSGGDPASEQAAPDWASTAEPPAELFEPRTPWGTWALWAGLAVLGLVILVFAYRKLARPRLQVERDGVPLPPHVTALRALAALRDAPRATPREIEGFYVSVSQVLRSYLEARFGLRAPERTTEEFLPEVERSGLLETSQRLHLRQFLEQCDLVKFANVVPDGRVHEETFAFAEDFVNSTRADRVAEASDPLANSGAHAAAGRDSAPQDAEGVA